MRRCKIIQKRLQKYLLICLIQQIALYFQFYLKKIECQFFKKSYNRDGGASKLGRIKDKSMNESLMYQWRVAGSEFEKIKIKMLSQKYNFIIIKQVNPSFPKKMQPDHQSKASLQSAQNKIHQKINFSEISEKGRNESINQTKQSKKPMQQLQRPKIFRNNLEIWEDWEIKKIFQLYREHGSQWKIIAERFPERPSNSIKNRFYTVIRNLLKQIFYFHPSLPNKVPQEISSKIILKFYQARQEFEYLGNLAKQLLEEISFEVNEDSSRRLAEKYQSEIKQIYELIFMPHSDEDFSSSSKNMKDSLGMGMCQQNYFHKKLKSLPEKLSSQPEEINSPISRASSCEMVHNGWMCLGQNGVGQVYCYWPSSYYWVPNQQVMQPGYSFASNIPY